jgi:hypothetical protein
MYQTSIYMQVLVSAKFTPVYMLEPQQLTSNGKAPLAKELAIMTLETLYLHHQKPLHKQ